MLEIGAHEGSDTAKFLAAMPGIRLHCFEPELRAFVRLRGAVGDDPRVSLFPVAVADDDGLLPFYASTGKAGSREDWDLSGSLHRPTAHLTRTPEITFKPAALVPSVRLDTWLDWHSETAIDFAWVDIQGAQRDFIAGARRALAAMRYLYIECHSTPLYEWEPTHDELIGLLPGFEPLGVYGGENILFRNRRF
jgi:FkbM family methyltransferase